MGVIAHLEELRIRLVRAILFLTGATLLCLIFSEQLLYFLTNAFKEDTTSHLALLHPTEGFIVRLKVAFVAGIFLSSPLWFSQIWGFISPGLYKNEKKIIIPAILFSTLAFIGGAAFGYWILPMAVAYFKSFATQGMAVSWSLAKYVDFSLRILIAFGVVFEMPLIVYVMARLGIVTTSQLRKYRKHAIIGILIASGLITPPDILTQIILAVPLIFLYEAGILLAVIGIKKSRGKAE